MGDVAAYGVANAVIVGTDVGGIFVGKNLAIHHDDGDATVVSLFHHGRDGLCLVGRDNQQIHPFVQKMADVLYLPFAIVLGGTDNDLQVTIETCLALHLGILLVAPFVIAALGDSDDISGPFGATRNKEKTA